MSKQDDLQSKEGRCVSCGFAGLRGGYGAEQKYYQITKIERKTKLVLSGVMAPTQGTMPFKPMGTRLACIKGIDLSADVQAFLDSGQTINEASQHVFEKDRHCPEWYPYQPSHDPEWHLNDYRMQQLENDRRDFELKLFSLSQQIQKDNKTIAKWVGIVVIILMAMQILEVWYFSTSAQESK